MPSEECRRLDMTSITVTPRSKKLVGFALEKCIRGYKLRVTAKATPSRGRRLARSRLTGKKNIQIDDRDWNLATLTSSLPLASPFAFLLRSSGSQCLLVTQGISLVRHDLAEPRE
ncbi:hypothetical protein IF2G_02019 [Cordyceps javanica]|nr:hypothetical protein IF2G_02019 [Cordyceps javanica]